jgi:sortase A
MRILIKRAALKGILKWAQRFFFTGAVLLLGYCVFVFEDAWVFQQRESRNLQRLLEERHKTTGDALKLRPATLTPALPAIAASGVIGRLEIPRLELSAVVIEGDDSKTLRRAVGHMPGTPLPGQTGNAAITGHRDTFFRPLRKIRVNDFIVLTTLQGEYHYRVISTRVVSPDNVAVLNASDGEILALVTCYPFYFVGSAPNRFIVRAERLAG